MRYNSGCFKIFFVCLFLNGCTECKTNWKYSKIKYFFLQGIELSPTQKTYKRLDTIIFEILVPDKILFDTLTKAGILTDSISLPLNFSVYNLNNSQPAAVDGYFDFVDSNKMKLPLDTTYSYLNHGIVFNTTTGCPGNTGYQLKIGMVLKDTGVYVMSIGGAPVNPCVFANNSTDSFSYIDYFFNQTDFNEDVFKSVPQNSRRQGRYDFDSRKIFAFRVTD